MRSILLLFAGFTALMGADTFIVNKVCRTDPALMIEKVTLSDEATTLSMKFEVIRTKAEGAWEIGVFPPGHDMAFFITEVTSTRKYLLLDARGIAIRPNVDLLKREGETQRFTLIFEPIAVRQFHLIEGTQHVAGATTWHFTNVTLDDAMRQ